MRLVHASDIHLDSPLRGLPRRFAPELGPFQAATRRALTRLVELCQSQRARLLLLAGDIFDGSNRNHATGLFFVEQMLRLESAGTEVVLVRGNHDASSPIVRCWMLPASVHELGLGGPETRIFDELGLAIHGYSYPEAKVTEDPLPGLPEPLSGLRNFGLLHTSVDGRQGHDGYAPTCLSRLRRKRYDYFALGHGHTPEILSEEPLIVFSGNLQGRTPRESGARGAMLIEFDNDRVSLAEHRSLEVVRFVTLDLEVSEATSFSTLLDHVAKGSAELQRRVTDAVVVRLHLHGEVAVAQLLSQSALLRVGAMAEAMHHHRLRPLWIESMWASCSGPEGPCFRLDPGTDTVDVH